MIVFNMVLKKDIIYILIGGLISIMVKLCFLCILLLLNLDGLNMVHLYSKDILWMINNMIDN